MKNREKKIYELLNLPYSDNMENDSEFLHIGTFTAESVEGAVQLLSNIYVKRINQILAIGGFSHLVTQHIEKQLWITYDSYYDLFEEHKKHESMIKTSSLNINEETREQKEERIKLHDPFQNIRLPEFRKKQLKQHYNSIRQPTLETYVKAIRHLKIKKLNNALEKPIPLYIPEESRRRHTQIVAGTGAGKSELSKVIIEHYERYKSAATVINDPKNDLAEEKAKSCPNPDNLIYINPTLDRHHTVVINSFHLPSRIRDDKERFPTVVRVLSEEITNSFEAIMKMPLTPNMQALIQPCCYVLLEREGSSFYDLKRFLSKGEDDNEDLIEAGRNSSNLMIAEFFKNSYTLKMWDQSRDAVSKKLQFLLNNEIFYFFTTGTSTLDLEQAIDEKKLIVCNFSEGSCGVETSRVMSIIMVQMLTGIALRRTGTSKEQRTTCHLYADETDTYASTLRTLLIKGRSYKIHVTAISQVEGQGLENHELKRIFKDNTDIKLFGKSDERKDLKIGEWYAQVGNSQSFKFNALTHLLGNSREMSSGQWNSAMKQQLEKYYRPIEDITLPKKDTKPQTVEIQTEEETPLDQLKKLQKNASETSTPEN